jgi:hypothetical protein
MFCLLIAGFSRWAVVSTCMNLGHMTDSACKGAILCAVLAAKLTPNTGTWGGWPVRQTADLPDLTDLAEFADLTDLCVP